MLVELSKEELNIIKCSLAWCTYWMENKHYLEEVQNLLSTLDKELEKQIGV